MFSKVLVTLFIGYSANAIAADCGWNNLTNEERAKLEMGEIVQKSDYSRGISDYNLESYGLSQGEVKLFEAVAAYYDYSTYSDGGSGLVDRITLSEGEKASNNPVLYRVTPHEENPFGDLYQPFNLSVAVRPNRETYVLNVDYLTSPNIVLDGQFEFCFAQVGKRVFTNLQSRFVGNPDLGFGTPGFGQKERDAIWTVIFTNTMKKISYATELQVENLKGALLGNMK